MERTGHRGTTGDRDAGGRGEVCAVVERLGGDRIVVSSTEEPALFSRLVLGAQLAIDGERITPVSVALECKAYVPPECTPAVWGQDRGIPLRRIEQTRHALGPGHNAMNAIVDPASGSRIRFTRRAELRDDRSISLGGRAGLAMQAGDPGAEMRHLAFAVVEHALVLSRGGGMGEVARQAAGFAREVVDVALRAGALGEAWQMASGLSHLAAGAQGRPLTERVVAHARRVVLGGGAEGLETLPESASEDVAAQVAAHAGEGLERALDALAAQAPRLSVRARLVLARGYAQAGAPGKGFDQLREAWEQGERAARKPRLLGDPADGAKGASSRQEAFREAVAAVHGAAGSGDVAQACEELVPGLFRTGALAVARVLRLARTGGEWTGLQEAVRGLETPQDRAAALAALASAPPAGAPGADEVARLALAATEEAPPGLERVRVYARLVLELQDREGMAALVAEARRAGGALASSPKLGMDFEAVLRKMAAEREDGAAVGPARPVGDGHDEEVTTPAGGPLGYEEAFPALSGGFPERVGALLRLAEGLGAPR